MLSFKKKGLVISASVLWFFGCSREIDNFEMQPRESFEKEKLDQHNMQKNRSEVLSTQKVQPYAQKENVLGLLLKIINTAPKNKNFSEITLQDIEAIIKELHEQIFEIYNSESNIYKQKDFELKEEKNQELISQMVNWFFEEKKKEESLKTIPRCLELLPDFFFMYLYFLNVYMNFEKMSFQGAVSKLHKIIVEIINKYILEINFIKKYGGNAVALEINAQMTQNISSEYFESKRSFFILEVINNKGYSNIPNKDEKDEKNEEIENLKEKIKNLELENKKLKEENKKPKQTNRIFAFLKSLLCPPRKKMY